MVQVIEKTVLNATCNLPTLIIACWFKVKIQTLKQLSEDEKPGVIKLEAVIKMLFKQKQCLATRDCYDQIYDS